jgi:putative Mg2+ transporter-C (MgtC) family protein
METLDQLLRVGPELVLEFVAAVVCGAAVGLERELAGKSAGLRTNLLICVGAMILTKISVLMGQVFGGDPTRIAAQIVTGIGFIGAGVILHAEQGGVKGLTTAAMIWLVAAIGMVIGSGHVVTALLLTAATLLVTFILHPVERRIARYRARLFRISIPDTETSRRRMLWLMQEHEDLVFEFAIEEASPVDGNVTFVFVFAGGSEERRRLLERIYAIGNARIEQEAAWRR